MQTPDEMDAALTFYMVFTEDDKVKMFISEDALFEALEEAIRTLMTRAYIANQMGIAEDQLDATLAAQGMTYQSFVDTTVETGLSDYRDGDNRPFPPADSEGNVVLSDGYYKLENEKLYISTTTEFTEDQGASFSYDKGVLTITEDGAQMEMKKQ